MRPDKNKAAAPGKTLPETLAALDQDLALLSVFLAAYARSDHPQRFEALRWLVPVLAGRVRAVRSSSRALAAARISSAAR